MFTGRLAPFRYKKDMAIRYKKDMTIRYKKDMAIRYKKDMAIRCKFVPFVPIPLIAGEARVGIAEAR